MTGPHSLLVTGRDGHVAALRRTDAGTWERADIAAHGRWPTWSPDLSLIARSTIVPVDENSTEVILAIEPDGTERCVFHQSTPGVLAVIAPNVPHYMLWAPSSDALSYVAVSEQGLALFISTLDGSLRSHRVATGAPLFHSWSPDGNRIILHAGTDVALFDRVTLSLTDIAQGAYGFRTPRFSPDGLRFVYAVPAGEGLALVEQEVQGHARQVAQFAGGVSFSWADNEHLFVAVASGGNADAFQKLWLVNVATGAREPVADVAFVAYWAAPAGDRVALVLPTHGGDGRFYLDVRGRDGQRTGATEPFLFSEDSRAAVTFFDQYELSHPVWAPDGSALTLCGRLGNDGVSSSWGDPAGDYVFYWPATRGAPLEIADPGGTASFPPPSADSSK